MSLEPWINCRNIQESVKFYTKVLDFEIVTAPSPDEAAFDSKHAVLRREEDLLHLDSHDQENAVYGTGFYARVENVDALFRLFVERGLQIKDKNLKNGPINQSWGMREFWFNDPDNNGITFGQKL